ncbi:MAG TPA: hypothetical protein VLA48_03440 [Nitrososphaeraceae archaeon]|nr:hypothetical protein [Nitrososphaeraceae archaeon]
MKALIKLKEKYTEETLEFPNEVFNKQNGVAFFEIDNNWELLSFKPFVCTIKGMDIYEGDRVLVKGTKKIGEYETIIMREQQGWTLQDNKTYLNNDRCFVAIIEKL